MPPRRTPTRTLRRVDAYGPGQLSSQYEALAQLPTIEVELAEHAGRRVRVWLGEADDGRLVVIGLLLDPLQNLEVTSRLLHHIRIPAVLSELPFPLLSAAQSGSSRIRSVRPGPAGYSDKHYERVAALYRQALGSRDHRNHPAQETARRMKCSEATVHRYLARCRELGYLEKRTPTPKERRKR